MCCTDLPAYRLLFLPERWQRMEQDQAGLRQEISGDFLNGGGPVSIRFEFHVFYPSLICFIIAFSSGITRTHNRSKSLPPFPAPLWSIVLCLLFGKPLIFVEPLCSKLPCLFFSLSKLIPQGAFISEKTMLLEPASLDVHHITWGRSWEAARSQLCCIYMVRVHWAGTQRCV